LLKKKGEIKGLISYWRGGWGEEIDFLCVKECENQSKIEDMLLQEVEKFVSGEKLFIALGAEKSIMKNGLKEATWGLLQLCQNTAVGDWLQP